MLVLAKRNQYLGAECKRCVCLVPSRFDRHKQSQRVGALSALSRLELLLESQRVSRWSGLPIKSVPVAHPASSRGLDS